MASIGESGLGSLDPAAPSRQAEMRRPSAGSGGQAGGTDRGAGVVVELSPAARASIEASRDAVSAAPESDGASARARTAEEPPPSARAEREERREAAAEEEAQAAEPRAAATGAKAGGPAGPADAQPVRIDLRA